MGLDEVKKQYLKSTQAVGIDLPLPKLQTLFELTWSNDSSEIISILENDEPKNKGELFEQYLGLLYFHLGHRVSVTRKGKDNGVDIVIYDDSENIIKLISAKNWNKRIDRPNMLKEIQLFESYIDSTPLTVRPYKEVFSLHGFTKEAKSIERYNVVVKDSHTLADMIQHAVLNPPCVPAIDLKPHNQLAVQHSLDFLKENNRICITHATGTGKSYVIASLIQQFEGKVLLCGPSNYIFDQFEKSFPLLWNRIQSITFQKLANQLPKMDQVSLIVLDEFHRCGAERWGNGVEQLLDQFPHIPIFGTSATPIRYLDQSRNMADELFDGWVASSLPLPEAIQRRLLPTPTYVSALYEIDEDIQQLAATVQQSRKTVTEKKELIGQLEAIKVNWRESKRIDIILKKYLPSDTKKIIVFFEDYTHLMSMRGRIIDWFWDAFNASVTDYLVYSKQTKKENDAMLSNFRNATPKTNNYHIMFSIDMLNEGIHIGDVGAVLLLRKTESPRLYYQQIGRCLQVDASQKPMIFDLVNNCLSIKANNFLEECDDALAQENEQRERDGLQPIKSNVIVHDQVEDIHTIFSKFQDTLMPWNIWFDLLVTYKKENNHANPAQSFESSEGQSLGAWCNKQRIAKKKDRLSDDRTQKLDGIGFIWNQYDHQWNIMFDLLVTYKKENNNEDPSQGFKTPEGQSLGAWCNKQRTEKKKNKLSSEKIQRLDGIGFIWDPFDQQWNIMFDLLVTYKEENNNEDPLQSFKTPEGQSLGAWCNTQRAEMKKRREKKKNTLSPEKIQRLDGIGFIWDSHDHKWNFMFDLLVTYKKENNNEDPPSAFKTPEGQSLGAWCTTQRTAKQKNELSSEKIQRLEGIGFIWDQYEHQWNFMFDLLVSYKKENNNEDPQQSFKTPEGQSLGAWCNTQRTAKKNDKLTDDRIQRLDGIGFRW